MLLWVDLNSFRGGKKDFLATKWQQGFIDASFSERLHWFQCKQCGRICWGGTDPGWLQFIPSSLPWWKFIFLFLNEGVVTQRWYWRILWWSGGVGGTSSSFHVDGDRLSRNFRQSSSAIWSFRIWLVLGRNRRVGLEVNVLRRHLQNDKLSPWFLFWGVCFIQELGTCLSWDRIAVQISPQTHDDLFAFWRQLLGFSLDKIAVCRGGGFYLFGLFSLPVEELLNDGVLLKPSWLRIVRMLFQIITLFKQLLSVHSSIQGILSLHKSTNCQKMLCCFPFFLETKPLCW